MNNDDLNKIGNEIEQRPIGSVNFKKTMYGKCDKHNIDMKKHYHKWKLICNGTYWCILCGDLKYRFDTGEIFYRRTTEHKNNIKSEKALRIVKNCMKGFLKQEK